MAWFGDEFWGEFEKQMREFKKMWPSTKSIFPELRMPFMSAPAAHIREEDGKIVIEIDMPGVKKDDIQIVATEHSVEVKAQRKELKAKEEKGFSSREMSARSYYQLLPMPMPIKPNTVQADYENGVLKLTAEKKEAKKKEEKKIAVKVK